VVKVAIERNQNFRTAKGNEQRLGVGIEDYGLPEMQGDLANSTCHGQAI
jgi:hypothetical protein